MFTWSHEIRSTAAPDALWAQYADVSGWPAWDSGLTSVLIDGPLEAGAVGTMQVPGQPPLTFRVTEATPGRSFTDVTEIPGVATLTFTHTIDAVDGGSVVRHEVTVDGPAAPGLGPQVVSDTPEAMARLVALAERASATMTG